MAQSYLSKSLVIMMISGDLEKLHMALMTAAAGAAVGRPVVLFVSKAATPIFADQGWSKAGGADYDARLSEKGVADGPVLFEALRSLDARFVVCDAALAEHDLLLGDMDPAFHFEVGGLSGLLVHHAGADWITF